MRRHLLALPLLLAPAACGGGQGTVTVEITMRYSRFEPATVVVPAGRAVRVVLRNADPIDHEWIVGDEGTHDRHEDGTEPRHDEIPTEVSVDALTERATTVRFGSGARLAYVCHLPGHAAYGMSGTLVVR